MTKPQLLASRYKDCNTRHAIYSQTGTSAALEAARRDPRALFRWREVEQRQQAQRQIQTQQFRSYLNFRFGREPRRFPTRRASDIHIDWNISLGTGTTKPGMYPAKFSFDTNATPNCLTDFAVFPVNVAGSPTQPNIVAFNNLYSGNTGATGICDGRTKPPGDTDVKTSATVFWSYNVNKIAGAVNTSPVLSFDATGSKVAFVESAVGSAAHFHVLAWKSGDGVGTNLQNALTPKPITTFTDPAAPVAGSGTASDLALGVAATGTDTLSSPYIDYGHDTAYIGNDAGVLFRIKNVFCTLASCGGASPSLDTTWGTAGAVTVCAGELTGPVQDFLSGNVYVGCADGKVYGFNSSGTALAIPSIAVGNGSANGGVVDSPIVDGLNRFIYAVSGTGAAPNTTHAVLVQATTSLSGPCAGGTLCVATVGNPGVHPAHAPAFNDSYFTSATSANWRILQGGFTGGTSGTLTLYGATFSAARAMTTGTPASTFTLGTTPGEYAPLTEFKNGAINWLFVGVFVVTPANLGLLNINNFPPAGFTQTVLEGSGPSGMIVDNASASAQASSIYFGVAGPNQAVKLTQAGLQ
jgi:hypothetical protein